jgi:hypothetical protein
MPTSRPSARPGVTVRLDPEAHARLQEIAKAEHPSVAAVLERLVEREIRARDDAGRVIRVHVAPELRGQPFGQPDRRRGESDRSYTRRRKTIETLFGREAAWRTARFRRDALYQGWPCPSSRKVSSCLL